MNTNPALVTTMDLTRSISGQQRAVTPLPANDKDWQQIVAVASAHLVLPALYAVVAPAAHDQSSRPANHEAQQFLCDMNTANGARNSRMRTCLISVARTLNTAGITPMALKGGAFLLDNEVAREGVQSNAGPGSWRFMSDLDLLIPAHQLPEAIEILGFEGFTTDGEAYDPDRDAHYPPMVSPCGEIAIELHSRLYADPAAKPAAETLVENAELVLVDGARLLRPRTEDRIAHLIGHAQLHNGFYGKKRILLRDLLDLSMLLKDCPRAINWTQVLASFTLARDHHAAAAFIAAWLQWQGPLAGLNHHTGKDCAVRALDISALPQLSLEDHKWAAQSLERLCWPQWRRGISSVASTAIKDLTSLATDPARRQRLHAALLNPAMLRSTINKRSAKFLQMLWA